MSVKSDHGWCEVLESCLYRAGIFRRGTTPDQVVSAQEAAAMPQGTVLRYEHHGGILWLVRDDAVEDNPARTRALPGSAFVGHWVEDGMTVARAGTGTMRIPVWGTTQFAWLPFNARCERNGNVYTRQSGVSGASFERGGYHNSPDDLGNGVTITSIPGIPS
jgi:hypothetical protein